MRDESERYIWLNKELVHVNDAKINVLSPTSQFGANVFEGIRCYYNDLTGKLYAFRLTDHFDRLKNSIKLFRIDNPFPETEWLDYIREVVRINQYQEDIALRMTVFVDGFGTWTSKTPAGMFIAPIPKSRKEIPLTKGISGCISSWRRISDNTLSPHIKVGANYINSRYAQLEAQQNGYGTAIFLNEFGKVAEGPGSCLFIVKNGVLVSPPLSASILDKKKKKTLISLAEDNNIAVEIRDIDRTELYTADEVFLCGSAAEITPVTNVDGYNIASGHVGELTISLHKEYINAAIGNNSRHLDWIAEI